MTDSRPSISGTPSTADKVVRHAAIDRVFHWIGAACVLTLLATAFLPILGLEFSWVGIHWVTGLVLIAAVLFHIVRSLAPRRFMAMWIGAVDVRDAAKLGRAMLRRDAGAEPKAGKYSFAQKLMHHGLALVVLTALATGGSMLARIDTPWWKRNPYLLSDSTWGVIYVLHGLAALLLITMVMVHVYFALRPENWLFLRAMLRGWITRKELVEHHDPRRWQVDR
ncbi:MAG: cytochrome b/b6 domain-containing protein [Gammaproteobacteria bacterium]